MAATPPNLQRGYAEQSWSRSANATDSQKDMDMIEDRCDDLIETIPNLRRYAFCLVGRKDEGDDLVEHVLCAIPTETDRLSGRSCSVAVFKLFNADQTVGTACRDAASRNAWAVDDALHAEVLTLPVRLRQALILVRTIGFSHDDTAEIVPCTTDDVRRCVTEAVDRILRQARRRPDSFMPHEETMQEPAPHWSRQAALGNGS